jgi:hypothetical protein
MRRTAAVFGLILGAASLARAQDPNREPQCVIDGVPQPGIECGPRSPNRDPLARYLYPPELVMANQQAINFTDRQRASLQQAMRETEGKLVDLQFKMMGEVENLQRLIQPSSVDEAKALDQVDRVLGVERDIKRAQLGLMLRIKNLLTDRQKAQLGALRRQGPGE